jgi:hypothetical protein
VTVPERWVRITCRGRMGDASRLAAREPSESASLLLPVVCGRDGCGQVLAQVVLTRYGRLFISRWVTYKPTTQGLGIVVQWEHRQFNSALEGVRRDRDLNDAAKARKIAALYAKLRDTLAELKTGHLEAQRAELQERQRKAFGPRVPLAADRAEEAALRSQYRQALVSVAQGDRETAERLMDLAMLAGDFVFARAVATVAVHQEWTDISDQYATGGDDPQWGDQVNALLAEGPTSQQRVTEGMVFSAPLPPELASLPTPDLNAAMDGASRDRQAAENDPGVPAFST